MLNVAIDIETTGLTEGVDEIIEIAIIPYDTNFKPTNRFISFIKPIRGLNKEALDINKITEKDLNSAPTPLQVRQLLIEWKENLYDDEKFLPLGHNIDKFDIPFLKLFLGQDTFKRIFDYHSRDTSVLAYGLKDAKCLPSDLKLNLIHLCKYFKVLESTHRAEKDALAALKVWEGLINIIKK